jgi:hypothetical protein
MIPVELANILFLKHIICEFLVSKTNSIITIFT